MKDLAVDACCLINLLATGTILADPLALKIKGKTSKPKRVAPVLAITLHVPTAVADESLYLLEPEDDNESNLIKVPIDLTPHFDAGILAECELEGEVETELFVSVCHETR